MASNEKKIKMPWDSHLNFESDSHWVDYAAFNRWFAEHIENLCGHGDDCELEGCPAQVMSEWRENLIGVEDSLFYVLFCNIFENLESE